MISYIKRKDLNIEKYNACIENAIQSRIYAFSWYLDIVCDNWDVLVLNDYEAVMPIPWRQKYFIKYVYPPLWLLELGVFSLDEKQEIMPFLKLLTSSFKYITLRLNTKNEALDLKYLKSKQLQFLNLEKGYDAIFKKYNRNRKREVANAKNHDLVENWNDKPENLIAIFKKNIAERLHKISEKDFVNLIKIMQLSIEKRVGELLTVYDQENNLVAAAFFLKHKKKVTQLVCASDILNRKNGAHTFFNNCAIKKYQTNFNIYNFGGSSMKNIAKFYKTFGAETEEYQQIEYNNLPFLLRVIKK